MSTPKWFGSPLGRLNLSVAENAPVTGVLSFTASARRLKNQDDVRITMAADDLRTLAAVPLLRVTAKTELSGAWSSPRRPVGEPATATSEFNLSAQSLGQHTLRLVARRPPKFTLPALLDHLDRVVVDSKSVSLAAYEGLARPPTSTGNSTCSCAPRGPSYLDRHGDRQRR